MRTAGSIESMAMSGWLLPAVITRCVMVSLIVMLGLDRFSFPRSRVRAR